MANTTFWKTMLINGTPRDAHTLCSQRQDLLRLSDFQTTYRDDRGRQVQLRDETDERKTVKAAFGRELEQATGPIK